MDIRSTSQGKVEGYMIIQAVQISGQSLLEVMFLLIWLQCKRIDSARSFRWKQRANLAKAVEYNGGETTTSPL